MTRRRNGGRHLTRLGLVVMCVLGAAFWVLVAAVFICLRYGG